MEVLAIAGLTVGGVVISSLVARALKGPTKLGIKYLAYKIKKNSAMKKFKAAVYDRNYRDFVVALKIIENIDTMYQTTNIERIFRLYNLTEEIIHNEIEFNKFYKLSLYDRLTPEEIDCIINNYKLERSLSGVNVGIDL